MRRFDWEALANGLTLVALICLSWAIPLIAIGIVMGWIRSPI